MPKVAVRYTGKAGKRAGERRVMSATEAKVLVAVGHAAYAADAADAPAQRVKRQYRRRDMTAEPAKQAAPRAAPAAIAPPPAAPNPAPSLNPYLTRNDGEA